MIPDEYLPLLDATVTGVLASIGPDGLPHASPIWFERDGDELLISTTNDRQKFRNVRDRPVASLTVIDPQQPLRYLELRGTVAIEPDPDYALRDRIAARHGLDGRTYDPPGTIRVVLRLTPTQVVRQ